MPKISFKKASEDPDIDVWTWTPENGYPDCDSDDDIGLYKENEIDTLFHINRSSHDTPVKTIYCKKCNGNEFHVGSDSYFTAIKCKTCGWECCIHEG